MANPSMKKNLILSTAYQILTLILPFMTAPYISRILGPEGVGIYSYTNSVQMYFSMFAALGTVSYGTREIARNRGDKEKRSLLFWEIELLTVTTTMVCLLFWGVLTMFGGAYRVYYGILTFSLLATLFDISWLYAGMEQFQYTVIQNAVFKLLGVLALFLFVKTEQHVAVYVLIMSLTTLLGNLSMWVYLPKFVARVPLRRLHILPHFKETFVYFVPTIATSVYTVLDKTLIGWITKEASENGYYEQATKIVNMAKAVTFTSLNSVLGSRISYLYAEKNYTEIKSRLHFSMEYILFMGFAICFGLVGVSKRFVPLFFGEGYDSVIVLLVMMSPLVLIIGISNCLGAQYYNPAGLRALSAKFIIAGSVVNLILNICLIPRFRSYGAVAASLVAELMITVLYLRHCAGMVRLSQIAASGWRKLVAAVAMLVSIWFLDKIIQRDIPAFLAEVCIGAAVYILLLVLLQDGFMKEGWQIVRMQLKRKGQRWK